MTTLAALFCAVCVCAPAAASRGEDGSGSSNSRPVWRTDLQQYAALSPAQRLSLLLGLVGSGDSLAADLAQHVAPYLGRLASSSGSGNDDDSSEALDSQVVLRQVRPCCHAACIAVPTLPQAVLLLSASAAGPVTLAALAGVTPMLQALEQEAGERLSWVVRLVQSEARQRTVFLSSRQLAKTAGACCYACRVRPAARLVLLACSRASHVAALVSHPKWFAVAQLLHLHSVLHSLVCARRPPMHGSC